jgi:ABC-2 type transport system ATP-binding protein
MFIRDGAIVLHAPMPEVGKRFSQLVARPETADTARGLLPIFAETRFGQTVMVFDGIDRAALEPLGTVSTPTLSDLFVALMSREGAS